MQLTGLFVAVLAGAEVASAACKRGYCENTPTSRQCWGSFNVDSDVTYTWPNTGITRSYNLNIQHATLAPDGVDKRMITVNGQYPGPVIEANWGDNVEVRVCNRLPTNRTSIHFHGIRQLNTNYADGATSQTECPIAPGDCHTYRWKATQHGTSWYHSHYSIQHAEGVLGPIVIHGPKTANYLGPLLLTDYYHESVFELATRPLVKCALGIPPIAINGLINGKNVYHDSGARYEIRFTPGKKHLLRLVNTGSEVTFRFAIDSHKMTVVAMDFVPIVPYETKTLLIAVGQRYDVIIEADQDPDDYWARAQPMLSCLAINLMAQNVRAIVRYDASSTATPNSIQWPMLDICRDEDLANLTPHIPHDVGPSAVTLDFDALLLPWKNDSLALRWQVGSLAPYKPPKSNPVATQALASAALNLTPDYVPIDLTHLQGKHWIYIIIESFLPLPHPIHLHGHDTYVLARGGGLYLDTILEVQTTNPPRSDTVNLPQNGFVLLAFETDNPGAWLLHCHIEWHLHDGFAMSVVEGGKQAMKGVWGAEEAEMKRVCANWEASGLETRE
ncbi:multicopper oxidase-domain-containing protein [Cercophora newfieldiana]|uniref:Multicopper oxidase-domain-containing protein n=1 Tax=Cercophora newfieldiana TaxID=92897 RepID=A0AA39XT35_9PEZI|nr:multicopper oxidase-domain-containing protein [Cercophora newfieldiana]